MRSSGGLALALLLAAGACARPEPAFEEIPSAETLYREGLEELEGRRVLGLVPYVNHQQAIDTFQEIIDNYPYSDYAVRAELRIADAYFEQEKYEEALSYYRDFSDLHPQHEQVPYTIYRAALCHSRRAKSPDRDQTATREALGYLDDLMRRYPHSPQAREAEAMWRDLRTRLARHVMTIGDFYLDREEWESASGRYQEVLNQYPGLGLDATALYKLGLCFNAMNRPEDARHIFEVLLRNYRDTDVAEAAADLVPAAN